MAQHNLYQIILLFIYFISIFILLFDLHILFFIIYLLNIYFILVAVVVDINGVVQDIGGAMSPAEVSAALGLSALKSRTWQIFKTSALKGDGLDEAMEWYENLTDS